MASLAEAIDVDAQSDGPAAPAPTPAPAPAPAAADAEGELPFGGDINAAMKAQDRAAIKTIMAARNRKPSTPAAPSDAAAAETPAADVGGGSGGGDTKQCPICNEQRDDVEMLEHAGEITGDIREHCACGYCRANMIRTNSSCPWCRSEMVWRNLYGFLDGMKAGIGSAASSGENDHQSLANLLAHWQEYEMCRSKSDIQMFARDLCTDTSLTEHVTRGLGNKSPWLRDSMGLWIRLFAMHADGEIELEAEDAERLNRVVDCCFEIFETNHGGHEDFIAAWYQQASTALLCAMLSGSSTTTLATLVRRAGTQAVEVYDSTYASKGSAHNEIRSRLNLEYVQAVQEMVWGGQDEDPVWNKFFNK